MIELIRVHRAHNGDVIGDFGKVRENFGHFLSGLAAPAELVRRAQQLRLALDEGELLPAQVRVGTRLTVVLDELGLVIEQVQGRGSTRHVQVNDTLCSPRLVRAARSERIGRIGRASQKVLIEERAQREGAHADAAVLEELTPGAIFQVFVVKSHRSRSRQFLVIVSSRFSSTLATTVHAACSAGSVPIGSGTGHMAISARAPRSYCGNAPGFRDRAGGAAQLPFRTATGRRTGGNRTRPGRAHSVHLQSLFFERASPHTPRTTGRSRSPALATGCWCAAGVRCRFRGSAHRTP